MKLPLNKKVQINSLKVAKKEKENFCAITRLDTIATQANLNVPKKKLLKIFLNNIVLLQNFRPIFRCVLSNVGF